MYVSPKKIDSGPLQAFWPLPPVPRSHVGACECQEMRRLFGQHVQQCCPGACTHGFDRSSIPMLIFKFVVCRLSFLFPLSDLFIHRTALPIRGRVSWSQEPETCWCTLQW